MNENLVKEEFNKLKDKDGYVLKDALYSEVNKRLGLDKPNPYQTTNTGLMCKDSDFESIITKLELIHIWDQVNLCYLLGERN